jgi:hypothetical protein
MKLSKHSLSKFLQAILFAAFLFGFNMQSIAQEISVWQFRQVNQANESSCMDGKSVFVVALGRYGITETIEIRTEFQINRDNVMTGDENETFNGLSAWSIGVRFNILNPDEATKPAWVSNSI